jgi:hypothetical protein
LSTSVNIISVSQLDEIGYQVLIEDGVMWVHDKEWRLLAETHRNPGWLYMLNIDIAWPVCLAARGDEEAWVWYTRFGHLHFVALRKLGRDGLVHGMPLLTQVEQVCEVCLAGKHLQAPFPQHALGRSIEVL